MALLHLSHLGTQAQSPVARSVPISHEGYAFGPIKERQINGTVQRPSGVPASALGQSWVGWVGLKTQAMIPRRVMLEPKRQQYIMYVVYVYALECANLRSFLGSPNQCDPGASLSENIGDQGIQEAKLASGKLGQQRQPTTLYFRT